MSVQNWRVWKLWTAQQYAYIVAPSSFAAIRAWVGKTGKRVDQHEEIQLNTESAKQRDTIRYYLEDRRIRAIAKREGHWITIWTLPS